MTTRFLVGDVFEQLATLEAGSVDLIVSSPPFLALRSYLPADHPDKAREIGSEATPGAYLDVLLDVVEACARVLAPHGSLVFELGDTYAGQPTGATSYDGKVTDDCQVTRVAPRKGEVGWPLDKSKVLVPQLFAVALSYGFNPLTGRQTEPWRVRNTVAWCRPNPPVGRDGDKFRPATSFLTVACKARDRYWDGDAVRQVNDPERMGRDDAGSGFAPRDARGSGLGNGALNPAGAPLLDFWTIPTHPYRGAHYATWPPDLVVPLVKSMCPARVCRVCGEPSRRIVGQTEEYAEFRARKNNGQHGTTPHTENVGNRDQGWDHQDDSAARGQTYTTLGFTDCGHDDWRPGLTLDPFAGSGTTLAVASGHGLDSIGVDLDPRNLDLARERVGMFLDVSGGCLD